MSNFENLSYPLALLKSISKEFDFFVDPELFFIPKTEFFPRTGDEVKIKELKNI
jgi:hypothetical protein